MCVSAFNDGETNAEAHTRASADGQTGDVFLMQSMVSQSSVIGTEPLD